MRGSLRENQITDRAEQLKYVLVKGLFGTDVDCLCTLDIWTRLTGNYGRPPPQPAAGWPLEGGDGFWCCRVAFIKLSQWWPTTLRKIRDVSDTLYYRMYMEHDSASHDLDDLEQIGLDVKA